MSDIDQLEKLYRLKENGVLTDEEFNSKKAQILLSVDKKKQPRFRFSLKGFWWKIPIIVIGLIGLYDSFQNNLQRNQQLTINSADCSSDSAQGLLKQAFDQSQFARNLKLSAIMITGVKMQNQDNKTGSSTCKALVTMNNTNIVPVSYKVDPQTRPCGRIATN